MDKNLYDNYCNILREELVPALGCTEPIAIAYASAKAREVLGKMPEHIEVNSSGNIIKNVKGVAVPNSGGMMGIEAAATLGVVGGDASQKLEVLQSLHEKDIEIAKQLISDGFCTCNLVKDVANLYLRVRVKAGEDTACVEIEHKHTNITCIEKNDEIIFSNKETTSFDTNNSVKENKADKSLLDVKDIITFADECDIEDVRDIIENQINLNTAIAEEGLEGNYGASIGRTLLTYYDENDVRVRAKAKAAAASDARMAGCSLPVVINSGSGNQGATVSLPVIEYAQYLGTDRDTLIRALIVSNLIALLQKYGIGNLSAYCGAISAATGAASGIIYLYGGRYEQISDTITNTLGNIGGVLCDGAKASCAAKIASAVDAAIMGAVMAGKGLKFPSKQGLVKDNVEDTINSYSRVAKDGMKKTDEEILEIMLDK